MTAASAVVVASGRFRKMPSLGDKMPADVVKTTVFCPECDDEFSTDVEIEYGDEIACAKRSGHVLVVRDREIVCENCPARWRNDGF